MMVSLFRHFKISDNQGLNQIPVKIQNGDYHRTAGKCRKLQLIDPQPAQEKSGPAHVDKEGEIRNRTKLSIQVRIDLNRHPADQENVEQVVNAASVIYYLARDFKSFYDWMQGIKKEGAAAKQTPNNLNNTKQNHVKDTK